MPQRTAVYLLIMLVPVLALLLLNALQIAPSVELKAALASFTAAGGAALGHGFAKDALAIAKAKKRAKRQQAAADAADAAARAGGYPRITAPSRPAPPYMGPEQDSGPVSESAETKRAPRTDLQPEEST